MSNRANGRTALQLTPTTAGDRILVREVAESIKPTAIVVWLNQGETICVLTFEKGGEGS